MLLKICHKNQIHLYRGEAKLVALKKHCQIVFKSLPKHFQFRYNDAEGDQISISVQQDLEILFEDQARGIKKIFIVESDQQPDVEFQMLGDEHAVKVYEGNPEILDQQDYLSQFNYCKIPISQYHKQIRTLNPLKQSIVQSHQISIQTNKYLQQLEQQIIDTIIEKKRQQQQQQNQLVSSQVNNYVIQLEDQVISKIIKEEQRMIQEEVYRFNENLMEKCCEKLAREIVESETQLKKEVGIQINYINLKNKNQACINKLVDDKINKLIPEIIKKVVKAVEARLVINGCFKCQRKQSQLEMETLIRKQLLKKANRRYHQC